MFFYVILIKYPSSISCEHFHRGLNKYHTTLISLGCHYGYMTLVKLGFQYVILFQIKYLNSPFPPKRRKNLNFFYFHLKLVIFII